MKRLWCRLHQLQKQRRSYEKLIGKIAVAQYEAGRVAAGLVSVDRGYSSSPRGTPALTCKGGWGPGGDFVNNAGPRGAKAVLGWAGRTDNLLPGRGTNKRSRFTQKHSLSFDRGRAAIGFGHAYSATGVTTPRNDTTCSPGPQTPKSP